MIKVQVPATSANVGAGFDSLGLAVSMYNTASFEENDTLQVSSSDGTYVPTGENNLIVRTVKQVFEECGKPFHGLTLVQTNAIPMARGLGSSSACIVAGILGANAMLGSPLTQEDELTLATKIEGHPDNVAPAILGGFVASAYDEGKVYSLKKDIQPTLEFATFIPDFKLLTEKARAALPKEVSHKDAVYNLSRAALCALAFCNERYDFLPIATKDSLHQQYRLPLIAGGEQIFALAKEHGALASFISGAGPTIMAVVEKQNESFWQSANNALQQTKETSAFTLHRFSADNQGAHIIE